VGWIGVDFVYGLDNSDNRNCRFQLFHDFCCGVARMTAGRPSSYNPEIAAEICAELALGKSLRKVCLPEDRPSVATIFIWFGKHPEFVEQYEKAKAECADFLAEEIIDIADDGTNDYMESLDPETGGVIGYKLNGEHVQRSRLRVDSRKWIASKLKPKKYGDRVIQQGDKNADPIQHEHSVKSILQEIDGSTGGLPMVPDADKIGRD